MFVGLLVDCVCMLIIIFVCAYPSICMCISARACVFICLKLLFQVYESFLEKREKAGRGNGRKNIRGNEGRRQQGEGRVNGR